MVCPNCGANVGNGESFCRVCGTRIVGSENNTTYSNGINNNTNFQSFNGGEQMRQNMVGSTNSIEQNNNPFQQMNMNVNNQMNNGMQYNTSNFNNMNDTSNIDSFVNPVNSVNDFDNNINDNINSTSNVNNFNDISDNTNVNSFNNISNDTNNSNITRNFNSDISNMDNNNVIDDYSLIDAYIGKNADKLRIGNFSGNTFFFGMMYVLYRKMWLLGITWLVLSMIINKFLPSYAGFLTGALNLTVSLTFKSMYLKHVKEEVEKIKATNPEKTPEQLLEICRKKGGTTIVPVIIACLLYAIAFKKHK